MAQEMQQVVSVSRRASTQGVRRGRGQVLWQRIRASIGWYPFIVYNVFIFVLFNLITWIYLVRTSFYRADLLMPSRWIGLDNFTRMVTDAKLHTALLNTFEFLLLSVPARSALALLVAIAVNRKLLGMRFFRAAYFLPVVTAASVLAMIWGRLFTYRADGPINYLLGLVGIPAQEFLISITQAMPVVSGMSIWGGFGYTMVIWLAGLQAIPAELYEAARVDGAEGWRLHWHITLPLLRPTAAFILVTSTIGALQVFAQIYMLTGGGPVNATTTLVYYLWMQSFPLGRLGYGSALSLLTFAIILLITYIQTRYLRVSEGVY